jgi:hypothetical protein
MYVANSRPTTKNSEKRSIIGILRKKKEKPGW